MAEVETLHDAPIDELKDLYNAERQLTKALPKLAKNATHRGLKTVLRSHLKETNVQGIIKEGNTMMEEIAAGPVMDAAILAGAQRAEHYEIGAYGTCIAWAKAMGHTQVARLLVQTLNQEKAADKKLSKPAEAGINEAATFGMQEEDD